MTPEEAKAIKIVIVKLECDRCGAVVGLHRHSKGYRCLLCIWNERENLIEWAKTVLSAPDYISSGTKISSILNDTKQAVIVSRRSLDALAEVVKEATA